MTIEQLQAAHPDARIEAGIGAVHYSQGNTGLSVQYDFSRTDCHQAAIDDLAVKIDRLLG